MLCFETLLKHSVWIYTSINFKDHLELPSESNEQKIPTSKFFFIFSKFNQSRQPASERVIISVLNVCWT